MTRYLSTAVSIGCAVVVVTALLPARASILGVSTSAVAKSCSSGWTHASLSWGHKCLRTGQNCKASGDDEYHGDGFHCHGTRLTSGGLGIPQSRARPPRKAPSRKRAQVISARITSVIDGDTLRVRAFAARKRFYTVRLIGIDTPETKKPGTPVECGGPEATAHMKRLAFAADGRGRRVTLRTDPTQGATDRYGRLLAYVTPSGKAMLQSRMLTAGWAKVYVYGDTPFKRVRSFRRAQRAAKTANRGVWSMCGGSVHRGGRGSMSEPTSGAVSHLRSMTTYAAQDTTRAHRGA